MAFKPLTSPRTALSNTGSDLGPQSPSSIKASTDERIYIIYDDSGSMGAGVYETNPNAQAFNSEQYLGTRQSLAAEATQEYLRNCKPLRTAVEIEPLNDSTISLTKNLPLIASKVKTIEASGGTPIHAKLEAFLVQHVVSNFTRALIFTDGEATDQPENELYSRLKATGVPIDLIIISDQTTLSENQEKLKALAESTRGTFLLCKDGKAFKAKMKYFAPLLRHQLAAVASANSRGEC